jgi:hypothetical protein
MSQGILTLLILEYIEFSIFPPAPPQYEPNAILMERRRHSADVFRPW